MPEHALPTPAKTLLRQLSSSVPAWSAAVSHAVGPCEFGGLSEDTDGEGKRRRVSNIEDVDSVLVRARHLDGRALVALWIRRPGETAAGRRNGWSLDMAWRGRHEGELTPHQITAGELKAYTGVPGGLDAIGEYRREQGRKAAARKRAAAVVPVELGKAA